VSKPFNFDASSVEESAEGLVALPLVKVEGPDDAVFVGPNFVDSPITRDAIARQKDADSIGGRGYTVECAGEGTAEIFWDALVAQARLLQQPDLMGGEWLNSGGHYDRQKGEWFNRDGATGIPIDVLHGVVIGRILHLGLSKETVDRYVTRKGRTVAEEQAFYRLPFKARMQALRTGAAL
jgi:hypothetical protein